MILFYRLLFVDDQFGRRRMALSHPSARATSPWVGMPLSATCAATTRPVAPPLVLLRGGTKTSKPNRSRNAPRCFDVSSLLPKILAVHNGLDFVGRHLDHIARNRVVQAQVALPKFMAYSTSPLVR